MDSDNHTADDDRQDRTHLTRRRVLASSAATWATVGLAGCNYVTDPGPEDDAGDDEEPEPGNTTVTNETTTTGGGGDGSGSDGSGSGSECASIRRFAAGSDIALNVGIYDQDSGGHLGVDDVESVVVEFPTAEFDPLELDWSGPHEDYRPEEWGGKLATDEDVSSGAYRYEIVIEGVEQTERISDQFTIV